MPPLSSLSHRPTIRRHRKYLSFWGGHEGSISKGPCEPIFSADVHPAAFDGLRGDPAQSSCHLVLDWRLRLSPGDRAIAQPTIPGAIDDGRPAAPGPASYLRFTLAMVAARSSP